MAESIKEEKKVVELSIDDILPNRFQPRIKFEDSAIFELSESIKAHGVFQPIIVRPIGDKYEIIAGERRYKASVLAGKKIVPAIIMNLNDNDTIEIALIENVQRANLTPIEEAISYKKILDMGYINQEQLANKLGKTQSTIANKLRLLNLDEEVQEALLENKISERHARSLLKLKKYEDQRQMLDKIIKERLTVRKTDEEINNMMNDNQNINNNPIIIDPTINTNQPTVNNQFVGNSVPSPEVTPMASVASVPVFGDINNEVINPSEITGGVINSTVISSEMSNNVVPTVETSIMDIQNIENTAADFNVAKPLAPMDQFLTSNPTNSIDNIPNPPVSNADEDSDGSSEDLLKPGKFFSFAVEEEKPAPAPDYNTAKNFNFDNLFATSINETTNNMVQNQQSVETKIDVQPINNSIPSTSIENNTQEVFSNPFGFNNAVNTLEQNQPQEVLMQPSETIPNVPVQNIIEPSINSQVNTNMEINSVSPMFENPTMPQAPVSQVEQTIATPQAPSMPGIDQLNPISAPSFITPEVNQPEVAQPQIFPVESAPASIPEPMISSPSYEEVPSPNNTELNIMGAVSTIRNAVSSVEKLGYQVDVDEIDLETMYQLIIKIEK